jgi:hypothetical protein
MPNYNAAIAEFQAQFDRLLEQRDQLDRQISGVKNVIDAIKTLADESDEFTIEIPPLPPAEEAGFTDRVRATLRANPALSLTAVVIRDEFLKTDPKADPKVLLIHTHNTLKRLLKQGEVVEASTSAGRGYRWNFASANAYANIFDSPEMREKVRAAVGRNPRGPTVKPPPGLDDLDQAPGLSAAPNARTHKK